MPSIAEIREQYPQYSDMSDQQLADALYQKHYSDIPRADFDAKVGLAPGGGADPRTVRGALLPFERNLDTGEISFAMPEVGQAVIDALKLPGDVASGETPIRDQDGNINREVIERSFDLGGIVSPGTAGRLPASASQKVMRQVPLKEGQQVAVSAKKLGVDLPRAIATDSMAKQRVAQGLKNVPVAGDPLVKASRGAVQQLDEAARGIQQGLGAGSRQVAGTGAKTDITNTIKDVFGAQVGRKYDLVDELVDDAITRPLKATKSVVDDIMSERGRAALKGEGRAASFVRDAIDRPEGLSYTGVKRLRTELGEMIDGSSPLPEGVSNGEIKRIYGALTDDMRATVRASGGKEAVARFDQANRFAAKIAGERKELARILGNKGTSDEAVFENIVALASNTNKSGNIGRLQLARKAVGNETWGEIASAAVARMGRQGADSEFSPARFLTAYGKMSPEGRVALFGRTTKDALDDIARVSTRFKQLEQFSNPSGTAQNVMQLGVAGAAGGSLATFNPLPVLGMVTAGAGVNIGARIMSRPVAAKQVARWASAHARLVKSPSRAAAAAVEDASRSLAITIARESGGALSAAHIQPVLQGIGKGAAVDGQQNGPAAEEVPARGPEDYDPRFDL
jgi:hypothetical protein